MAAEHEITLRKVLPALPGLDWARYQKLIVCKYARRKLSLARQFGCIPLADECVATLRANGDLRRMDLVWQYGTKSRTMNICFRGVDTVRRLVRRRRLLR